MKNFKDDLEGIELGFILISVIFPIVVAILIELTA